ncbi:zinc finger BED domain-containing protein RICESLEEPER 2-like [Papaver somniferum]|uniref:zinc finger BED domain-containing protein RICESLEEPER 2-like n=1 Tax=Papaver somniferum TaxID=3469 RepID=UPI000E6FC9CF|nr:zinc finger BED domain-containing protein RICESLEEPER 2-like [Papaver somniferum]
MTTISTRGESEQSEHHVETIPSSPMDDDHGETAEANITGDCDNAEGEIVIVSGKKRSIVWNHFENKKIKGEDKAVCKYCHKPLGGKSTNGTKHLHAHMKRCPRRKQQDIRQSIITPSKKSDGRSQLNTYSFDQSFARKELAYMIIIHEYPLSIVEHAGFRRYSNALQPFFKVVSRSTIKRDILKIYDEEKTKTMEVLQKHQGKIALTTDMWTSKQNKGYMVITAHFIDESWILQSRIIRFMYVPCPHTAEVLSAALMECLLDWNIDGKVSTLTVDNCSTNDLMIQLLLEKLSSNLMSGGDIFHMRCCAHILALIVKKGLEGIKGAIELIRNSVAYWKATPKRVEKFEEAARQLNISSINKLVLDCETRCNSTYLMLNTAIKYHKVFARLKQREPQYDCLPDDEDWLLAKEMCDKLKIFYTFTEKFSGVKYPTTNLFFPSFFDIRLSLNEWKKSKVGVIKEMAYEMIENFEEYWFVINGVMAVAIMLDPRFKMKLIEFYFPQIYGQAFSKIEIDRVRDLCVDLATEYELKVKFAETFVSQNDLSFTSEMHGFNDDVDLLEKFYMFVSNTAPTSTVKSELTNYLEEDLLPRIVYG